MKLRLRAPTALLVLGLPFVLAAAEPSVDAEREKEALLRADADFSDAAQKVGVGEAFAQFADENATMLPPGQNAIRGIEAVRKQFADYPRGATLSWKPNAAEVARSGDLGYTLGTYIWRGPDPEGRKVTRYGKYCSVWKKQKDGRWKWVVDVGTPSPSPESPRRN
jgi:ketosteroid isomerase-like protein